MPFIDFAAVKAAVKIEDAAQALGLQLKKSGAGLRGSCPACNTTDARGLVVTPNKGFYCFALEKGGDVIGLVSHIKGMEAKEAAAWLQEQYGLNSTVSTGTVRKNHATVPQNEKAGSTCPVLDYLDPEHDAVQAVGFDPATAKALGIGYAMKGLMRGTVAVPIRDEQGNLTGYIGVTECRLPPRFQLGSNVVKLKTA